MVTRIPEQRPEHTQRIAYRSAGVLAGRAQCQPLLARRLEKLYRYAHLLGASRVSPQAADPLLATDTKPQLVPLSVPVLLSGNEALQCQRGKLLRGQIQGS